MDKKPNDQNKENENWQQWSHTSGAFFSFDTSRPPPTIQNNGTPRANPNRSSNHEMANRDATPPVSNMSQVYTDFKAFVENNLCKRIETKIDLSCDTCTSNEDPRTIVKSVVPQEKKSGRPEVPGSSAEVTSSYASKVKESGTPSTSIEGARSGRSVIPKVKESGPSCVSSKIEHYERSGRSVLPNGNKSRTSFVPSTRARGARSGRSVIPNGKESGTPCAPSTNAERAESSRSVIPNGKKSGSHCVPSTSGWSVTPKRKESGTPCIPSTSAEGARSGWSVIPKEKESGSPCVPSTSAGGARSGWSVKRKVKEEDSPCVPSTSGGGARSEIAVLPSASTDNLHYSRGAIPKRIPKSRVAGGANGIFTRRLDFSSFNALPKIKLNSYQIKTEDEGNHGNDDTRCFILSTLASHNRSKVQCVLCGEYLLVFDRYPLVDGTFFLSPRQHAKFCIEVKVEGRTQFLTCVCMGCLEGKSGRQVYCRYCMVQWDGSSLVLGTMYSYDIFAAMPCCTERMTCNSCTQPVLHPAQRLNYFSDYSHMVPCPHCRTLDTHFVKSLPYCFIQRHPRPFAQWP